MTRHKTLKGLEKITEFLKIIFASGNTDDKPLSCILVAPVSSGKTTAIKQFKNNHKIKIETDSTAYGMLKEHKNELEKGEISHFVIPDLLNSLARRKSTADQLILFINASSEDGLFPSHTYGMDVNRFIEPFGWVLCLTKDGYNRKKKFLKEIGFISRFFVIEYSYSLEQIQEILKDVISESHLKTPEIIIKQRKNKQKIEGNEEIFEKLIPYSKLLCRESDSEIIRMQKKLQSFLKASAYLRNDKKVNEEDLKKLEELIDLIQ